MSAFVDAYVKYCTQFPTLGSLGSGNPPDAWLAELNSVSASAFDPVTFTDLTLEGGQAAGRLNFEQMHLVRALYAVRAARDPAFVNPYSQPIPEPMTGKRIGHIVRLGL